MATELQSTRSAAVLLLALGESEAATVLKHLDAKVVQRLGTAMAQVKSASREEVNEVVGGFVATMDSQADIRVGSDEYVRKMLTEALVAVMDHLEDAPWLEQQLSAMGAKHVSYGVQDEMYAYVGECLVAALKDAAGDGWTPRVEKAWIGAFGAISGIMIAGAKRAREADKLSA